jgi:tetratricopeptide (TPR) repeat protein
MVIVIIVWLILSILVGNMGTSKQIGGAGAFFISIIFSPLIGLLFVIASAPATRKAGTGRANKPSPMVIKLTNEALKKYKNAEYDSAIEILQKALTYGSKVSQTHFNLASLYSMNQNKEKALHHLSLAVEYGYNNFNKIATSNDFDWLRKQPEYEEFVSKGYKLNIDIQKDYLNELQDIAKLRETGVLTEDEFQKQKAKILATRH